MDYGRGIINWQNQVEGRPFARGGTGCACGMAGIGAAKPVRVVAWLMATSSMPSLATAANAVGGRVVGAIPGFEDIQQNLGIVESVGPGVLGMSSWARVYPLTTPAGEPVDAGDAIYDAEVAIDRGLAGVAQLEETVTGVTQIKGGDQAAAQERASWYRTQIEVFAAALERMRREVFIPLAIQMYVIKSARPNKRYEPALKDLQAKAATLTQRLGWMQTSMAGWQVEADWQARNAANQSLLGKLKSLMNQLNAALQSVIGAVQKSAAALETAAEGVEQVVGDSKKAAGAAGVIAVGMIGLIAVLMLSGRKK